MFRALQGIPKETGTAKPQPAEIANVTQGGTGGLQVLVAYVEGGGKHATTKQVKWQVAGTDAGFGRSAPWAAEGNALGPFEEGQTVRKRIAIDDHRRLLHERVLIGSNAGGQELRGVSVFAFVRSQRRVEIIPAQPRKQKQQTQNTQP